MGKEAEAPEAWMRRERGRMGGKLGRGEEAWPHR